MFIIFTICCILIGLVFTNLNAGELLRRGSKDYIAAPVEDFLATPIEEFYDIKKCDNSTRFEAVDTNSRDDIALCKNIKLKQVFLVRCGGDEKSAIEWRKKRRGKEGDCPGRRVMRIIDGNKTTSFDLKDETGKKIPLDKMKEWGGDIGIDISDSRSADLNMRDAKLSDGENTTCGLKYTLPITADQYSNTDGKPKCKFILNLNKNK